jgi:non-lysosomal glucosylceramidase
LPCACFIFQIENICGEERKVSISFVMKNGTGSKKQDSAGSPKSSTFVSGDDVHGATITQTIAGMPCNYSIGVNKTEKMKVSTVAKIDPFGNGSKVWKDVNENGMLTEKCEDKNLKDGKDVCVGVSGMVNLAPSSENEIEFAFVWDFPKIKFGSKSSKIRTKFYTKYFDDDGNSGVKILDYAFKNYSNWEQLIAEWQKSILDDE